MANLTISEFFGMYPRRSRRLLPDSIAQEARDVQARNGGLEGRPQDDLLYGPSILSGGPARKVHRFASTTVGTTMFLFLTEAEADVVRAPQVNDIYERYYWAGATIPPSFAPATNIYLGGGATTFAYRLGHPQPAVATVTEHVPGSDPDEDRFYVYTLVDEYGQETQPCDPVEVTTKEDSTTRIVIPSVPIDPDRPNYEKARIYRTVVANNDTEFFLVTEETVTPGSPLTYDDTKKSKRVVLRDILQSTTWAAPPDDMAGMAAMPNGIVAGFRGRDVLFCEPYRPHAWPPEYTLSVEDEIVGIAAFDTNLAILTKGTPYIASGVNPAAMSLTRVGPYNACVARRSIVPMSGAVLYASEDGLVALSAAGQQLATRGIIGRRVWLRDFDPANLVAARDGDASYVGFAVGGGGFEFNFAEPERGVVYLTPPLASADPAPEVVGVDADANGNRVLLTMLGAGDTTSIFRLAPEYSDPVSYVWTSKEFFLTKPVNMGAAQINSIPADAAPEQTVHFELIADGVTRFSGDVETDAPFKLPCGYKAQVYQFRFTGNKPVSRFMIAETERELAFV